MGGSLLAKVDLLVPLSPDLCGSEHTTRSAHVTESSLSSTVSSSTGDTRNTGNSTTCVDVLARALSFNSPPPKSIIPNPQISRSLPSPRMKCCVRTSTPGLSRGLVASFLAHGIWLTLILRNTGVDGLDDIRSDGRSEDLFNCNQLAPPMPFPSSKHNSHTIANSPNEIFRDARTFGRGWVAPLAVPSADKMVTVGREAISKVDDLVVVSRWSLN